ncbi:hypothetical protein [Flavilitoribacter nigricans]|uniref:Uncharacterized protein n=1 Tax=Flavilitoribacter nigricans (strain ATCC 23147 / DSM 23189 / NBRC 102662 / NCIMB 1420 / SS-2) TaxID=1122177 RepID=A0A2D0N8A3_FLAN2|nr:hypothetical protein [Flavilitoribacter nigricans]PHN04379.1 hypothetical protein CRP01_22740 [Flavilitoribacter nigricans DSM 23189 = NBRC 102662]
MAKKGNSSYWRNRVQQARYNPERFRGQVKSRGETKAPEKTKTEAGSWSKKVKAQGMTRSQSWAAKVQQGKISGRRPSLSTMKNRIQRSKKKAERQGRAIFSRSVPVGLKDKTRAMATWKKKRSGLTQPGKRPLTKDTQKSVQARGQNFTKRPQPKLQKKAAPSIGASKLKAMVSKSQTPKAPQKSVSPPSKGAAMLKQTATKIVRQSKSVKKVKAPVIRRGR